MVTFLLNNAKTETVFRNKWNNNNSNVLNTNVEAIIYMQFLKPSFVLNKVTLWGWTLMLGLN